MDACVLLLVANQFDEIEVVRYTVKLRQAGIPVEIVGLTSGLVRGQSGLLLMPDRSLSCVDVAGGNVIRMIILAGGKSCAAHLLSDPRTKALIAQTVEQNGTIIILQGVLPFLHDAGLIQPSMTNCFLIQEDIKSADFINSILKRFN